VVSGAPLVVREIERGRVNVNVDDDHRVMTLMANARKRAVPDRDRFLRLACSDNNELYREVADALAWEERMGGFLQQPMLDFVDLARPFHPGQTVAGRFEILRELGEGGMGVVFEAFDQRRKQKIAIKAAKPGFQSLLCPELEGALRVRHPNICLVNEIHAAAAAHGEVDFLTMELLEGPTLAAHLSQHGKLAKTDALQIARQLCAGLAEAHRSGIIHRDLKAANIILCRSAQGEMRAVITDFGLAGAATAESSDFAGTPAYMAPELLRGEGTSKASDIYALGVILYEIITGCRPATERVIPPSRLTKGADRRWDRVILQCLSASPEQRPPDASQVARGLESKWLRKETLLAAALAVATIAAIGSQLPGFRLWLEDHLWSQAPNVRLAVLPFGGPDDIALIGGDILEDVSGRLVRLRSARRTLVVIPPQESLSNQVRTPEQAKRVLHATHALQTSLHRDGKVLVAKVSIVDLETQVKVGELSGRYSQEAVSTMATAFTGAVSLALRLEGAGASDTLSAEATAPYERGLHLLRNDSQSFAKVIPLFEAAARLDPRSPLPLAGLVEARVEEFRATKNSKSIESAQQVLRVAESLSPDSVWVRLASGLLHETSGDYEKAREDYQRVLELDPRNIDAWLRTASVYGALDMPERAVDGYRKAMQLEPGYYKPHHDLAVFYYFRGRYREAAEEFRESIARAPGRVNEYINLAGTLIDLEQDGEAERALLTSLQLRETANAHNNLGVIRAFKRIDAQALTHFRRAVALDGSDYFYWLNLADTARRMHLLAEAAAAYRSGMDLARAELTQNPKLGLTRASVAYFEARLGDSKTAETNIAEAMKFSPGDSKVIRRAVLTYEALGLRADAIAMLGEAPSRALRELDRHPDLADLARDPRFRELLVKTGKGDEGP
jgi:serine/threonine-protein kinase